MPFTGALLHELSSISVIANDVILATALGFDVNARINLSLKIMDIIDGQFRWTTINGIGFAAFGSAVSAGIISHLDREQMRNAFGMTG